MTLMGKLKAEPKNLAAKHFKLCHGELAIWDAVGQPADSDPTKSCYKKTAVAQWQNKKWETFLLISS